MRLTINICILLSAFFFKPAQAGEVIKTGCQNEIMCKAHEMSLALTGFLNGFNKAPSFEGVPRRTIAIVKTEADRSEKQDKVDDEEFSRLDETRFDRIINEAGKNNGVDPRLVKAVVSRESKFNPRAVSRKGAKGLMQLMPENYRSRGIDPFDPEENIHAGTKYLSENMEMFKGNVRLALAAYNAGPRTVKEAGGIPDIQETKDFVKAVLKTYREYKDG